MNDTQILSGIIKRMKKRDEDPLSPLIDRYLIDRVRSKSRLEQYTVPMLSRRRPPGRLSPSTISGCIRQAAFVFVGVRGRLKIDPDREMRFVQGDWIHHKWAALFLDMEQVLGEEIFRVLSIEETVHIPRLYISGTLDFRLYIEGMGEIVVDIKSIHERGFFYVVRQAAPKEEHARQAMTYARASRVKKAILLYENKNNQQYRTEPVTRTAEIWTEVEDWCKKTIAYMERRELPPMHVECNHGSFLWEKCPFSHICFGNQTEEVIEGKTYHNFPGVRQAYRRSKVASEHPR